MRTNALAGRKTELSLIAKGSLFCSQPAAPLKAASPDASQHVDHEHTSGRDDDCGCSRT
jgi:hypothetical protein